MSSSTTMCLSEIPLGIAARITGLCGEPQVCCRLREFGFCESALIERVSGVGTLLCQLGQTKIALNRQLANSIRVELLT